MRKLFLPILLVISLIMAGAAYFIGDYFIKYALLRNDTDNSTNEAPAAGANIQDPTRLLPDMPKSQNETWTIESKDGLKLYATYFKSDNSSHQWALLVHGYGRDQRYTWDYAEEYIENNYNVVTPDLRASGLSEGTYITMGAKESDDILLWIKAILEEDPEAKIILHGVSMGAATVMITAGKSQSPNLVAVIEDCGYTNAYDIFTEQLEKIFGLPKYPIMPCVDFMSKIKVGVKISEAAPIEYVQNIKVPILFIHGTEDKLVPYYMMQMLYDRCDSPVKEMVSFNGVGHADAKIANPDLYFDKIFNFLNQYVH